MRFTSQRVRITGFTITDRGPVGRAFIQATDEVLVLYGVNGAGKSTLIEAIVAGLQGLAGGAEVHLAVGRPMEQADYHDDEDEVLRALLNAGADHMNRVLDQTGHYHLWDPEEYGVHPAASAHFRNPGDYFSEDNNLGNAVAAMLRWELPPGSPMAAAADEIAAQGLFTLRPVGSAVKPLWDVFVSAVEDEAAPATRALLGECRTMWSDWADTGSEEDAAEEILMHFIDCGLTPEGFREDILLGANRPAWVPYAIEDFGRLRGAASPAAIVSEGLDPYEATLAYLAPGTGRPNLVAAMDEDSLVLLPSVEQHLFEVQARANRIFELLVVDPPVLEVAVTHPNDWLHGTGPVGWEAVDLPSLRTVPLHGLSGFQRRWASFAIGLAAQGHVLNSDLREVFLVVDEPERAAHPRAVSHLAQGLARVGEQYGARVVVASHSAEFLSPVASQLVHVHRDAHGRGVAEPLDGVLADDLAAVQARLGLGAADVLQLIRVFLIVEGQHDVSVISAMVGDALRQRRVHLMAMRGTRNLLTLLDSQFLTAFTDAAFVVVLDRTSTSKVRRAADALRSAYEEATDKTGRPRMIQKALAPLQGGTSEERVVAELLQALAHAGALDRFEVHGLSKPDIIEYLPVTDFLPDAPSWSEAKRNWPRGTDFKEWLRSLGARVSAKALESLASQVDQIPRDFSELVETCDRAAMGHRRANEIDRQRG